jgi:hypothetical protein
MIIILFSLTFGIYSCQNYLNWLCPCSNSSVDSCTQIYPYLSQVQVITD